MDQKVSANPSNNNSTKTPMAMVQKVSAISSNNNSTKTPMAMDQKVSAISSNNNSTKTPMAMDQKVSAISSSNNSTKTPMAMVQKASAISSNNNSTKTPVAIAKKTSANSKNNNNNNSTKTPMAMAQKASAISSNNNSTKTPVALAQKASAISSNNNSTKTPVALAAVRSRSRSVGELEAEIAALEAETQGRKAKTDALEAELVALEAQAKLISNPQSRTTTTKKLDLEGNQHNQGQTRPVTMTTRNREETPISRHSPTMEDMEAGIAALDAETAATKIKAAAIEAELAAMPQPRTAIVGRSFDAPPKTKRAAVARNYACTPSTSQDANANATTVDTAQDGAKTQVRNTNAAADDDSSNDDYGNNVYKLTLPSINKGVTTAALPTGMMATALLTGMIAKTTTHHASQPESTAIDGQKPDPAPPAAAATTAVTTVRHEPKEYVETTATTEALSPPPPIANSVLHNFRAALMLSSRELRQAPAKDEERSNDGVGAQKRRKRKNDANIPTDHDPVSEEPKMDPFQQVSDHYKRSKTTTTAAAAADHPSQPAEHVAAAAAPYNLSAIGLSRNKHDKKATAAGSTSSITSTSSFRRLLPLASRKREEDGDAEDFRRDPAAAAVSAASIDRTTNDQSEGLVEARRKDATHLESRAMESSFVVRQGMVTMAQHDNNQNGDVNASYLTAGVSLEDDMKRPAANRSKKNRLSSQHRPDADFGDTYADDGEQEQPMDDAREAALKSPRKRPREKGSTAVIASDIRRRSSRAAAQTANVALQFVHGSKNDHSHHQQELPTPKSRLVRKHHQAKKAAAAAAGGVGNSAGPLLNNEDLMDDSLIDNDAPNALYDEIDEPMGDGGDDDDEEEDDEDPGQLARLVDQNGKADLADTVLQTTELVAETIVFFPWTWRSSNSDDKNNNSDPNDGGGNRNSNNSMGGSVGLVAAALVQFARDVIVPAMQAYQSNSDSNRNDEGSTYNHTRNAVYPTPVIIGTMLLLRELLIQNSSTIFGTETFGDLVEEEASSIGMSLQEADEEESLTQSQQQEEMMQSRLFLASTLATSVIIAALEKVNGGSLVAKFMRTMDSYDDGDADFASLLGPLDIEKPAILPDGQQMDAQERTMWQSSYNLHAENHPARKKGSEMFSVPSTNAVHITTFQMPGTI
ncbi:hypothetical protein ACA910_007276 [Epithemia clementina (nom. ined.)]